MKQITQHTERGGTRGYDSEQERYDDIEALKKQGFTHFVHYRDTQAPIALCYAKTTTEVSDSMIERDDVRRPFESYIDAARREADAENES